VRHSVDSIAVKVHVFCTLMLCVVTDWFHTSAVQSANKISIVTGRWLSVSYINIDYHLNDGRYCNTFFKLVSLLGAFAKLRKATANFVMSVCLSVRRLPLDGFS